MKHSNLYRFTLTAAVLIAVLASCKKGDYLTDGGVHSAQSSLSTYDYLKNHNYHYFDTTILLIDHFNLKDTVNKAGTFFAFTDFSVQRLMQENGYATLEDLYANTTSKLLTQYLFSDKNITAENVSLNAVLYPNWAGDTAQSAIRKVAGSYPVYLTSSTPTFDYFTLSYVKINGVLDGSSGAPPDDPVDLELPCQTTGILMATGTTLHVLSNTALLNQL